MSKPPRGLSPDEAALWSRVAATVVPINPPRNGEGEPSVARDARGAKHGGGVGASVPDLAATPRQPPHPNATSGPLARTPPPFLRNGPPPRSGEDLRPLTQHGLDSSWERKLTRAAIAPDFTLDLHGYTLDQAHARLDHGLTLALAQQARLVLVIAGKPRPAEAADRGQRRGAIRAKLLDWLAASPHGSKIAAVRQAHQRHGGAGAVYVVLKRGR